jgi:hypothetical protein
MPGFALAKEITVDAFNLYRFLNASDCRLVAGPFRLMQDEVSGMAADIAQDYAICVHAQIRCPTHGWQGVHQDMCGECYLTNTGSQSKATFHTFKQAFRPHVRGKRQPAHVPFFHRGGRPHHLLAAHAGG